MVLEYVADEARSRNPSIHVYAEEALKAYIYYKVIERKSTVPMGRSKELDLSTTMNSESKLG